MKLPRDTQPFPTCVPEDKGRVAGTDLMRSNEVVSATGRTLDWPPRGQPDANVNTPKEGPTIER